MAAALGELRDLKQGLEAASALGRCRHLGRLLDEALASVDPRSWCSEAGGAAGGRAASGDVEGGCALVACALAAHPSASSDLWGTFHLLAAGFLTADTWAGLKYDSGSGVWRARIACTRSARKRVSVPNVVGSC